MASRVGKLEGAQEQLTRAIEQQTNALSRLTDGITILHRDIGGLRSDLSNVDKRLANLEPTVIHNSISDAKQEAANLQKQEGFENRSSLTRTIIAIVAVISSIVSAAIAYLLNGTR